MANAKPLPSLSRLNEMFVCDPEKGELYWKISPSSTVRAGDRAGGIWTSKEGHQRWVVSIKRRQIQLHRIIYLMATGREADEVCHKNGDGLDNRISNLRASDRHKTANNQRMPSHNTTGVIGVSFHKEDEVWQCSYYVHKKRYTKAVKDFFEAVCWRKSMECRHGMADLKKDRKD